MKNRIFFILLLLAISISSIVQAEEYSFDPTTRVLSTPYFSMTLSDYWGMNYVEEDGFLTVSNSINEVTFTCGPLINHKEYYTKEDVGDVLEQLLATSQNTYIEYDKEEYLDGYVKDMYEFVEDILIHFEFYSFRVNNNESVATLIMSNHKADSLETTKQIFRLDLETITVNDFASPVSVPTSQVVLVDPNSGTKYHKYHHNNGSLVTIPIEEAMARGYTPCDICFGD